MHITVPPDCALRTLALPPQHVRERLLRVLYGQPQHNAAWCELSTVLARVLKQPQLLDHVQENLRELEEVGVKS